jgi:Asp-tRNA(Asn)/Glu-tRNA(Gln) amidotransferase A subunit family amidase
MTDEVNRRTAAELSGGLRSSQISGEEIARACLQRIASRDAEVRAWSYVDPGAVIRQARELDKLPSRGALHGIPFGIKDIYNTADMPT